MQQKLQNDIRSIIGLEQKGVYTFFKGRVGLFAVLRAIGINRDDEVLLPAYTCVVVPNAIKYLGATPRYVDIDIASFSVPPTRMIKAIGAHTKAVICQNTYGLSFGVDEIVASCVALGVQTIEDCTHGFGGTYKGKPNGSWCDAAFYSSQWNKPFSSGVGGYVLVNNEDLRYAVEDFAAALPLPSLKTCMMLAVLLRVRSMISPSTYYAFVDAYRFLSKRNLVTGSSSGEELESTAMPRDYLLGMSAVQAKAALRSLKRLPALNALRKSNGALYTARLIEMGVNHVAFKFHSDHLFLKYPLLVADRDDFLRRARAAKLPFGDWFRSPLHPIEGELSKWDFDPSRYPNAVFAAEHVVNIPTDTRNPERVLAFLEKNKDQILPGEKGR